jgi:transposase-like protein
MDLTARYLEVAKLPGRKPRERRGEIDGETGYRNGYGKPHQLSTQGGTIRVRAPRVRALEPMEALTDSCYSCF